ncbi:MAG: ornithine carbamoyltransferase, partial [Methanolinea sp. SDB]
MKKDLISILDLSETELDDLIAEAGRLKEQRRRNQPHLLLEGKNLAMIFEKSSTRTRISFEVGMNELGGNALFLNAEDLQIGRGEEIRDTARVTSRYVSGVMIRAYRHETITDFARYSSVPVINGLSDREHPCQLLADILTIKEHRGYTRGVKVAWVGDGDNVCNSFILASAITGLDVVVASPAGYLPPEDIISEARARGGSVKIVSEPEEAVMDADVVVTDTWVSMGDDAERGARLKAFRGFSVTAELMDHAADDAIFMH